MRLLRGRSLLLLLRITLERVLANFAHRVSVLNYTITSVDYTIKRPLIEQCITTILLYPHSSTLLLLLLL
jgi:hypothetical protein